MSCLVILAASVFEIYHAEKTTDVHTHTDRQTDRQTQLKTVLPRLPSARVIKNVPNFTVAI